MKTALARPLLFLFASVHLAQAAEPEPVLTDVFLAPADGYPSIRIPSIVVTNAGTLLAFAEGRLRNSDQAENDIVLKRSTDGGLTWGELQVMDEDGANSLNNPTAVVEQQSGRILLMYQRIPEQLKEASKDTAQATRATRSIATSSSGPTTMV